MYNYSLTIPGPAALVILRGMERNLSFIPGDEKVLRARLAELESMNLRWSDVELGREKRELKKFLNQK